MTPGGQGEEAGRFLSMARVLRPWGREGAVAVSLETDRPEERFRAGARLEARGEAGVRELTVSWWREKGRGAVIRFDEVTGIAEAESLRGATLGLPRDKAGPTPEGRILYDDLIGLRALDPEGSLLGTVVSVREAGSQVLLEVRTPAGERLVPFHRDLCPEVSLERGHLVLDLPEGLLDPERAVDAR